MTEPLHHIIMILFGIILEQSNGLLLKASKSRLKPVKAGGLDNTNKSRLFANPGLCPRVTCPYIIYNIFSLHYKECYLSYKLISEMIILCIYYCHLVFCIQILFHISNMVIIWMNYYNTLKKISGLVKTIAG